MCQNMPKSDLYVTLKFNGDVHWLVSPFKLRDISTQEIIHNLSVYISIFSL